MCHRQRVQSAALALTQLFLWQTSSSFQNCQAETVKLPFWQDTGTAKQWLEQQNTKEKRKQALDDLEYRLLGMLPMPPAHPQADYFNWLAHLLWMRLSLQEEEKNSLHEQIAQQPALVRTFLKHLSAYDDLPAAVGILHELWNSDPESVRNYPNMAVAFALVWDQPLKNNWVSHALPPNILKPGNETIPERFAFYVNSAKQRRLENDPALLSARELMFVVDSPLPLSELEWAQKNVRQSRSNFNTVYFSINYDHKRFSNYLKLENDRTAYLWPHPDYTLMTIKEKGGVCAEQAHFAVNAAQAKAIPAIYFGGSGATSLHAWMGYMERPGRWHLDVGKYAAENFPVGQALDPQTRRTISDDEIHLLTASRPQSSRPGIEPALLRSWALIKIHPDQRTALARLPELHLYDEETRKFYQKQLSAADSSLIPLLELARTLDPEDIQSWRLETWLLQHTSATPEKLRAQLEKRAAQFSRTNEFYTEALQPLIPLLRQLGENKKADELQKELLRKNRRKRFDIGIDIGTDSLLEKIDNEDWQAAHQEFRKILRRFGDKGGGTLFYNLIVPYITALRESGQDKLLQDSFDYIDRQMPIPRGTQLHNEYIKLQNY